MHNLTELEIAALNLYTVLQTRKNLEAIPPGIHLLDDDTNRYDLKELLECFVEQIQPK